MITKIIITTGALISLAFLWGSWLALRSTLREEKLEKPSVDE